MTDWVLNNAMLLRLTAFLTILIALAIIETYRPKRQLTLPRLMRWKHNIAVAVFNNIILKITMPLFAIDAALYSQTHQIGVLPTLFELNTLSTNLIVIFFAIIILDIIIYFQHRLFHKVPLLWRLHSMHHSDLDFDVTTAIRFHPIEIMFSLCIKIAAILLFGVPVLAVIIFEVLLNISAMFNHSNIALPKKLDTLLRYLIVTPDMHRIHHSIDPTETNHNYGFFLSWWDWLFNSYQATPKVDHQSMTIGLPYFREQTEYKIQRMLTQPFRTNIFNKQR